MSDNLFGIDYSKTANMSEEAYLLDMRASIDKRLEALKKNREQEADPKQVSNLAAGLSAVIYTDGSYNQTSNNYGYGVYMKIDGEESVLFGSDPCGYDGRNVEGEVAGAVKALEAARAAGVTDVTVYYDYEGVASWADKVWKTNKPYTKAYAQKVDEFRQTMRIQFSHVKSHTAVLGNEYADRIAKLACNMGLTKSDIEMLDDIKHLKGFPTELLEEHRRKFGVNASGDKKTYLEEDAIKIHKQASESEPDFPTRKKRFL